MKDFRLVRRLTGWFACGACLITLLGGSLAPAQAEEAAKETIDLPRTMVWNAYDLGSSGYAEASGIANALQEEFDTRIRIVPTGTAIGRMLALATGKVKYGFLANEVFFSSEGLFDFADRDWGPQDVRVLLGRPATNGFAVAADTGVKEVADLKGKRVGYVKGSPAVNVKNDAYLAFAGLTRDEVTPVWFGSYAALKDALVSDQIDAFSSVTTSAMMREIEASGRGLIWPPFDRENKQGWAAMQDMISFVSPTEEGIGASLSPDDPTWLVGYRYPMITTYASTSDEEVYNLVKAIDETFDLYSSTTGSSKNWVLSRSATTPADAPFHPAAIRYAKEKGVWTEEDQAWQDKRLARAKALQAAWDEAMVSFDEMRAAKEAEGVKVDTAEAWPAYWANHRKNAISQLQ